MLILQSLDCENSVVIDNGEEVSGSLQLSRECLFTEDVHPQVSKWYVVLNGQLKLLRESDSEKLYHVGDL